MFDQLQLYHTMLKGTASSGYPNMNMFSPHPYQLSYRQGIKHRRNQGGVFNNYVDMTNQGQQWGQSGYSPYQQGRNQRVFPNPYQQGKGVRQRGPIQQSNYYGRVPTMR